jgi:hypothetical protein
MNKVGLVSLVYCRDLTAYVGISVYGTYTEPFGGTTSPHHMPLSTLNAVAYSDTRPTPP